MKYSQVIKLNAVFYNEQLIGYEVGQLIREGRSENEHISAVYLHPGGNIWDLPFFAAVSGICRFWQDD